MEEALQIPFRALGLMFIMPRFNGLQGMLVGAAGGRSSLRKMPLKAGGFAAPPSGVTIMSDAVHTGTFDVTLILGPW